MESFIVLGALFVIAGCVVSSILVENHYLTLRSDERENYVKSILIEVAAATAVFVALYVTGIGKRGGWWYIGLGLSACLFLLVAYMVEGNTVNQNNLLEMGAGLALYIVLERWYAGQLRKAAEERRRRGYYSDLIIGLHALPEFQTRKWAILETEESARKVLRDLKQELRKIKEFEEQAQRERVD